MSGEKLKELDVATGAEMRRLLPHDRLRRQVLRPSMVPEPLRDLIPTAERWGVTCDVTRHEVAEHATEAELQEIREALKGRHAAIHDFLYSDQQDDRVPEVSAFQALLVFELEECEGPGIPGELEYWLSKHQQNASPMHRERVESAYHARMAFLTRPSDRKFYEAQLSEAERIIGRS